MTKTSDCYMLMVCTLELQTLELAADDGHSVGDWADIGGDP